MTRDTDGPHSRTAAAVRNAKRLVEVEMADVGADIPGTAKSYLGIHVGAVHIHLSTMRMHNLADASHTRLEDSMGRWVSEHQRS